MYKMQHLEGSGTPALYIGRTVLKGQNNSMPSNVSATAGPLNPQLAGDMLPLTE